MTTKPGIREHIRSDPVPFEPGKQRSQRGGNGAIFYEALGIEMENEFRVCHCVLSS